jgi:pyruvate dehydrogenase E2 component (dihydrolipoamide acetyltransferase)
MSSSIEVKVPDIGDFKSVEVIELLVKPGDRVSKEQSLITVESDKASMEIPSSHAGLVKSVVVKIGDKVAEGSVVLMLEADSGAALSVAAAAPAPAQATAAVPAPASVVVPASVTVPAAISAPVAAVAQTVASSPSSVVSTASLPSTASVPASMGTSASQPSSPSQGSLPHASPSVRKFARELGVNLSLVKGSGPKDRITPEDVRLFVKAALAAPLAASTAAAGVTGAQGDGLAGLGLPAWPKVDFAKFGPVTTTALGRIKKISGPALHRNWVMIPHVTNNEDADITELEAFRVKLNQENEKSGLKLTMLAFLIKASVSALKKFPEFNASLDGDQLVLKQYYHIGFAADTPNGLMVPVIKDADKKGLFDIATEMGELAKKARDGKLGPSDMQGGTFSISSLGGIGGTSFTPIINAPEVAILGVSRSAMKPVWDGSQFVPRLILPMSLSWDHRVIDGAGAARFNAYLASVLADFRRVML